MRKIIGASLLIAALSCLTYAGNMPTPGADPQATPTPSSPTQTTDGHIPNDEPAESTVAEAMLSLVQSLLSLF